MATVSNPRLVGEGVLAGFVGGAVSYVLWLAALTSGIPGRVEVVGLGVTELQWFNFTLVGIATGLGAGLVALLVDGRRSSRRLFTVIAVAVLVLSGYPLLGQPAEVELATLVLLAVLHVVVFIAVVPRLAGRLRAR